MVKVKFFEFEIYLITGIKVEKEYFKEEHLKSIRQKISDEEDSPL